MVNCNDAPEQSTGRHATGPLRACRMTWEYSCAQQVPLKIWNPLIQSYTRVRVLAVTAGPNPSPSRRPRSVARQRLGQANVRRGHDA